MSFVKIRTGSSGTSGWAVVPASAIGRIEGRGDEPARVWSTAGSHIGWMDAAAADELCRTYVSASPNWFVPDHAGLGPARPVVAWAIRDGRPEPVTADLDAASLTMDEQP